MLIVSLFLKGQKLIIFDQNIFRKTHTNGSTNYYKCNQLYCKKRIVENENGINETRSSKEKEHNHDSLMDEVQKRQKINELKITAKYTNEKTCSIISNVLKESPKPIKNIMPNRKNLKQILNYTRQKYTIKFVSTVLMIKFMNFFSFL